jgi:hypothetical protein
MSQKLSLNQLRLKIADIIISLVPVSNNDWKLKLKGATQRFIGNGDPDIVLKVYYGFLPSLNLEKQVFSSGGNWTLFKNKSNWIFSLQSPATGPSPYASAIIKSNFKYGEIYVREHNSLTKRGKPLVNPLEYPLDEILMVNLLSRGRGVLTHACGIAYRGGALLFVGTSGAGKSTIANIWKKEKGATILSDDRIIIRKMDSKFWIYGTPWHGDAKLCSPWQAPLKKVFFLKHAENNIVKKISPVNAASHLIVCLFPTFWDKEGMGFTLNFCGELAKKVPCYELGFVPDKCILDFIRDKI